MLGETTMGKMDSNISLRKHMAIIIDLNIHTTIGSVGHTNTQYDYHYNCQIQTTIHFLCLERVLAAMISRKYTPINPMDE